VIFINSFFTAQSITGIAKSPIIAIFIGREAKEKIISFKNNFLSHLTKIKYEKSSLLAN
jgi:hypothetical protein